LLLDAGRRERMGQAAQQVFERERGAVQRIMQLIDAQLQE
jgi:3-deoxy-D-manno-octulosonic-acid transferase